MLWTVVVILITLWALGLASAQTMGGLIHLLLFVAIIVMAVRLVQGKRVM